MTNLTDTEKTVLQRMLQLKEKFGPCWFPTSSQIALGALGFVTGKEAHETLNSLLHKGYVRSEPVRDGHGWSMRVQLAPKALEER